MELSIYYVFLVEYTYITIPPKCILKQCKLLFNLIENKRRKSPIFLYAMRSVSSTVQEQGGDGKHDLHHYNYFD